MQSHRGKHKTNRKGPDDPRPEWRFQQPGENRKEYLKRYQCEYHRQEWYPGHKKERIQETIDRRAELQEWYTNYKATLHCKNCGEWRPECLQFHHLNPSEKEFNVSEWIRNGISLERLKAEVTKCDVLCANCHATENPERTFQVEKDPL